MRALSLPLLLIGCFENEAEDELPLTIEMSNPDEGMPVELDPTGPGVEVLVAVSDEATDTLLVRWETDREGLYAEYTVASGVGRDDVSYELYLPPETEGDQTLTFRVANERGEEAAREWAIEIVEAP